MGLDSPPQQPPSKSSPPSKRSKISPTYTKTSPAIAGTQPHPAAHPRASIDEKLESMPMQRVSQMDLGISTAYQAAAYASQPQYGSMFQQFGPPPGMQHLPPQMPQPPPPPQPQQQSMYGAAPPGPGGPLPYGQPQPIPTHYQTGGGSSGHPNYYQHQPMPPAGRGGYYQGPP